MGEHEVKPIKFHTSGGLWKDIKTYWHRARYGWAPRDCWSLDDHLATVLAGSLRHLADHHHGTPICYPQQQQQPDEAGHIAGDVDTDHAKWEADLRRWADTFQAYAERWEFPCNASDEDFKAHHEEGQRRIKAAQDALREITPWFPNLWD